MKDSKEVAIVIVAILLLTFFFAYELQNDNKINNEVIEDTKNACLLVCKTANISKSNGPCLSNNIAPDWVCDIAHSPRQAVDDNPDNQCQSYLSGHAHHFVEVTPDCKFIRAV